MATALPHYSSNASLIVTDVAKLKETIEQFGVAVLDNVFTEPECELVKQKILARLAKEHNVSRPDDFEKLKPLRGLMLKYFGVALMPEVLELKTDERVIKIFQHLWQEDELSTSFDSMTILPPPELKTQKTFFDPSEIWLHTDQSSDKLGLQCIQSFINLEHIEEGDGCLSILLNSHRYHQQFFQHFNTTTRGKNWFKIDKDAHLEWYTKEKGCLWQMISAPKGAMVFWDSRMVYMCALPREGRVNLDRWLFIVHVCYTPARLQSKEDKRLKRSAFMNNCTTSHWPFGVKVERKIELDNGQNDLRRLNMRQRKLFGIE